MQIPVLMYHKVGAPVVHKHDTFLNVPQRSFTRQMRLLHRMGYQAVTFHQAVLGLYHGERLPSRPVCITFDDGYANIQTHAAPVLKELGWPGTVFVPTGWVGAENGWDAAYGNPLLPLMGWHALAELHDAGWEIAGHTRLHPKLAELDDTAAAAEISGGAEDQRNSLGGAPTTFCYPFGSLNIRTPDLVHRAGMLAACTTKSGIAKPQTDPMRIPRVKIAYRDDVWGLFYRLRIRPFLP
jgi:peptidoglycan/xylan/chitin deacetylase (PgdA/CDA1 family)